MVVDAKDFKTMGKKYETKETIMIVNGLGVYDDYWC